MKKNASKKISTPSAAAIAAAILLVGLSGFCQAAPAREESNAVTLKVTAPRMGLQKEAVVIGIDYVVAVDDLPSPGEAAVTYHNVDTGENFVKKMEVPLTRGKHKTQAVWDADETLPSGMYVVTVALQDAGGRPLARYETSPDKVQSMMVHGGALTRMLDPDQVIKEVEDLTTWREELEKLEAAARAAGADTTRQKILIVVLREMKFWSGESLGGKRYDILDINHRYLKREVAKAKEELESLAKNPGAFPKEAEIPRPKERFTIRDGGFYAGDRQMFLSGPCFFNFTIQYLPVARDLGFNVIQVSTGPNAVFPTSEEPTGTPRISDYNERTQTGQLKDVLDHSAELGMKVDLGLTSHFMPKWVYEKWPDAKNPFVLYNMMPYDIEHPEVLKLIERFYENVMPQIAGHPALNSIWIANEPEYMNPNERNIAIFRPWLQGKYKTIESLNRHWGTTLKSFDDIVASGRKGHPVPDAASTDGAKLDWWKYSTERLMRHYDWQMSLIRKYDPGLPISVKLYNGTFNPQFKPMSRADEESSFERMAYMGISGGSFPFSKPYKDFLRSLDPSKPLANLEYKFGGVLTRLFFWQEAMQGATDINWWCWHPNRAFSPVPKDAVSMHQAAIAKLDIQRLLPQVSAFHKRPGAPMVLLYPDPVAPRYWEYFAFNDPANRALTEIGYTCDYASEKSVAQGRLDDYQVLVMPAANFIRDETFEKVKAFVDGGKTAIVLGAIPDQNEYSQPRDASFFKPREPVSELIGGAFKAVKFSAGKGTVYHLSEVPRSPDGRNHLTQESAELIQDVLELALSETLPAQPVVIRDANKRAFIENRTVAYTNPTGEKTYLTYVVNDWLDEEQVIEPTFNFTVKSARDLITDETLAPDRIVVPPASIRLVEFAVNPESH